MVFAGALLHAHDDVAVHLDEATVAVERETLIAAGGDEALDGRAQPDLAGRAPAVLLECTGVAPVWRLSMRVRLSRKRLPM